MSGPHIVVPVKAYALAKQRLSPVATPERRSEIAAALCEHVLAELTNVGGIDGVTIVSAEPTMRALAHRHGYDLLREDRSAGLNAAVRFAYETLEARGISDIGIVLADLPLFSAIELERVLAHHGAQRGRCMTLVPDRRRDGTNVRLCRSPRQVPPMYGRCSVWRHWLGAAMRGMTTTMVAAPGLAHDLDTPEDLRDLAQARPLQRETVHA